MRRRGRIARSSYYKYNYIGRSDELLRCRNYGIMGNSPMTSCVSLSTVGSVHLLIKVNSNFFSLHINTVKY